MANQKNIKIDPDTDLDKIFQEFSADNSFTEDPPPNSTGQQKQKDPSNKEPSGKDLLAAAEIDLQAELMPPQTCLEIIQDGISYSLASLGDFTLVLGKPKSRKTFYITSLLAAVVKNDVVLNAAGSLPDNQRTVLAFDTEQGKYHAQKAARRVLELAGHNYSKNFKAFTLRNYNPNERIAAIEYAIENTPNLGFVVIDGVRDVAFDINDSKEASKVASLLLKWSYEKNIHIVVVLHENKGNDMARGHLGAELQNKAQTVLSVAKDAKNKDISIVSPKYCRDRDFIDFAFEIDSNTLPQLVEGWSLESKNSDKPKDIISDLSTGSHLDLLAAVFATNPKPKYAEFQEILKEAFQDKFGAKLPDHKARGLINLYSGKNLVEKIGKDRAPGTHYILTQNE